MGDLPGRALSGSDPPPDTNQINCRLGPWQAFPRELLSDAEHARHFLTSTQTVHPTSTKITTAYRPVLHAHTCAFTGTQRAITTPRNTTCRPGKTGQFCHPKEHPCLHLPHPRSGKKIGRSRKEVCTPCLHLHAPLTLGAPGRPQRRLEPGQRRTRSSPSPRAPPTTPKTNAAAGDTPAASGCGCLPRQPSAARWRRQASSAARRSAERTWGRYP